MSARLNALQLKVVTCGIDAVKMRVCGEEGVTAPPPHTHTEDSGQRYINGSRCGAFHAITRRVAILPTAAPLWDGPANGFTCSFICLFMRTAPQVCLPARYFLFPCSSVTTRAGNTVSRDSLPNITPRVQYFISVTLFRHSRLTCGPR